MILALIATGLTSPAIGRTVEYLSKLDAVRAAAEEQGIPGPFSEVPSPGKMTISLETPAAADHRVIVASVLCKAYNIENPISTLLQSLVAAPDASPNADVRGSFVIRVLSGSTVLRCMNKDDFNTACKARVRISAEAIVTNPDGSILKTPIIAQVERPGRVGGFCGNVGRYIGIVTREAGIELIAQAITAAGG